MSANPYEAPKSSISGVTFLDAPKLWNPNAAANWSLPFTPAFGAFVHMKNWQSLGQTGRATASRNWLIAILIIHFAGLAVVIFLPGPLPTALNRLANFVLLVSWYFASARGQTKYLDSQLGGNYVRKGWGKPILFGALMIVGFFLVAFMLGMIAGLIRAGNL